MLIRYIDLKKLDSFEKDEVESIASKSCEKIDVFLKNAAATSTLVFDIKKYDTTGKAAKYSIHLRLDVPNLKFSAKAADWDLARVLHKVFNKLEHEVKHKFRSEGQPQEIFRPLQRKKRK